MTLAPGTQLGPYEILSPLGAGGMGEVYKARDTRLDRIVAVKILPAEFSSDPARRARFTREAKTISHLNHPRICVLHDVGEADLPSPESRSPNPASFLVMEYLEGQTLAQRLAKGRLALDEALRIGAEIADALAAAHRHGVIHRDLKPSNVMLARNGGTSSGPPTVKLLDFGLAKVRDEAMVADESAGPTETESLTNERTLVGTLPYMAPEQVEGRPADARTDIWALGCVLYEMVTGARAFDGDSQASLIAAIMSHQPPALSEVQPVAPPALEHIVRRCLAKDLDERWQTASDVKGELSWVRCQTTPETAAAGLRRPSVRFVVWTLIAACGVVALGVGAVALWMGRWASGPAAWPPTRVQVDANVAPVGSAFARIAISPDGRTVAYEGQDSDGARRLYIRALDSAESRPVPDTEDAVQPFFSPDGRWLGYFVFPTTLGAGVPLKRVLLPDGPAETIISHAVNPMGAAWGPDDTILFTTQEKGMVLLRVPAGGGTPVRLMQTDPKRGEWYLMNPRFLPGGRALLVTASDATCAGSRVLLQPLDGGPPRTVLDRAGDARYLPSGHLLFVRDGAVLIAPFDPVQGLVGSPASPLAEPVSLAGLACQTAAMDVSDDGTLAYLPHGGPVGTRLVWVDRRGQEQPTNLGPGGTGRLGAAREIAPFVSGVRISPEGKRIVAAFSESRYVAVIDLQRNVETRLSAGSTYWPIWTPDGQRVAFSLVLPDAPNIHVYWRRADGSGPAERLTSGEQAQNPRAFTSDGKTLIYQQHVDPETGFDVWALSLESDATPRPLLRERYNEYHPSLSPDGQWLAFVSEESGRPEICVRPFPSLDTQWVVSTDGGVAPAWRRDGRELFYQQGATRGSRLFSVRVDTLSGFSAEAPTLLFEGPYYSAIAYGQSYDVAPDGERFLMTKLELPPPPAQVRLVLNWFEELKASARVTK